MKRFRIIGILYLFFPLMLSAQSKSSEKDAVKMVKQIYKEVSAKDAEHVDWDRVRSFFDEDAIILLRTSLDATTRLTVDGFIRDFKDFYNSPRMNGLGFKEKVLSLESKVYKDMAYIGVLYGAQILKPGVPMQRGIDFWLLVKKEEGWKVLAVTNEVVLPGEEVPDSLFPD